ncbi:Universal stress protein UspA-related nucleotide-binding protein [Rubrobacter radiotolerans]|uniref:Universal stress protein n=1 Tax=Rubrobacter radiotolerans TaxID=42256 RepID=A0A023X5Y5_RUBRA|nr:universal stress protein [Rubrobacter radiotolerans]AHY47591.1 Universal stress protein UspA-related nucleotide-binding protein [Rubrobacter radiotolerans]MDX5894996.1 universal stress protein [Rubrobacter radiotolerans]SMC07238.1 Nucleotide-binding universal stress protein, UspA family [Rubrobacter radiotolerans DSM 5868]
MSFFPRKILLAADRSEESRLAVEAAADLSKETGSELHVVYVGLISPWVQSNTLSPTQYRRLRAEAQEVLDEQVRAVESLGGKVTQAHLRMGRADSEIIRLGEELSAELIVIGSRGQHTISRVLLGNNAESIVRHAPCPVLVTRKDR